MPVQQRPWSEKERIGEDVPCVSWIDLSRQSWAALLCIHGLSLHSSSFTAFGKRMSGLGIPTYAIDVRGFGCWQNTKECSRVDFKAALADVKSALEAVHRAHPHLPVVLLGESMGGAIALQAAAANQELVDGLIASVPAGTRRGQAMTVFQVATTLVVAPNRILNVGPGLVKQATGNASVTSSWEFDPLSRMGFSAKELTAFDSFAKNNELSAQKLDDVPVLIVQRQGDRVIKAAGSIELYNQVKTTDKDLMILNGREHLIFEEGEFDDHIIGIISSWIDNHVADKKNGVPNYNSDPSGTKIQPADSPLTQGGSGPGSTSFEEALGHLCLGRGFICLNEPIKARDELSQVFKTAGGSRLAVEADNLLLSLPAATVAPPTGPMTRVLAENLKFASYTGAMANDKPSVLVFYAPWVDTYKALTADVEKLLKTYGDRVNFVMIDADEPQNRELIDKYGIRPLPSVLFLNVANEVISYSVGYSGSAALAQGIEQLLQLKSTSLSTSPTIPTNSANSTSSISRRF